jgi:ribosomal protein S18 acetylase RimI-like enzyme
MVIGPVPGCAAPSDDLVRRTVADLHAAGHGLVVTPALDRLEREPFLRSGGEVIDELHLLSHDLDDLDRIAHPHRGHRDAVILRRARRRDWDAVAGLDARAFDSFWHFDTDEIADAVDATPFTRFRVAVGPGASGPDGPLGYAVCGRAGRVGFVQRLAVDPAAQGRGVGSALLLDGLHWMRRRGARRALVNTQRTNARALALYRRHGFALEPAGLSVVAFRRDRA